MVDLKTTYLGLELKNPIVASSSPISEKIERVQAFEEAGVSAVVMYSLFEEQIIHESLELDHYLNKDTESYSEALTYFPEVGRYTLSPELYIERVKSLKKAVNIPIIGSLNGVSTGGWIEYAKRIEDAGADALELNLYYLPTDLNLSSAELETAYITLVENVCSKVQIPIAVKLSQAFTALPNFAHQVVNAGAKGLVLFNRFYQPDFDLEKLEVVPNLILSSPQELRLPLRWIAILYGKVNADFALTTGVHKSIHVVKAMMAGAKVAMLASAFLKKGPKKAVKIIKDLEKWLDDNEYDSIKQMQGSMSQQAIADPSAFERANYMKVLNSFTS
jgi:dihydroorotate dehydrogenase (fumarate)